MASSTYSLAFLVLLVALVAGSTLRNTGENIRNVPLSPSSPSSANDHNKLSSSSDNNEDDKQTITIPWPREILSLQFLFRHGDRAPIALYPNDPYVNYNFKEGLGNLNLRGKERMFGYGQVLRKRYGKYLDQVLHRNIKARSTNSRRVLETTLSVLAGAFPPKSNDDIWSRSLLDLEAKRLAKLWQPIPVDTVPAENDYLLGPEFTCKAANKWESSLLTNPAVQQLVSENEEFLNKVCTYSGLGENCGLLALIVQENIRIESRYFGPLYIQPSWLNKVGPDAQQRLDSILSQLLNLLVSSRPYLDLRTGAFLRQVVENAQASLNAQDKVANFFGSHDEFVMLVLQSLGFFPGNAFLPDYGSGIIVEVWRQQIPLFPANPQVSLYYSNVTNNYDIYELDLSQSSVFSPYCTAGRKNCELKNFAQALAKYANFDADAECNNENVTLTH